MGTVDLVCHVTLLEWPPSATCTPSGERAPALPWIDVVVEEVWIHWSFGVVFFLLFLTGILHWLLGWHNRFTRSIFPPSYLFLFFGACAVLLTAILSGDRLAGPMAIMFGALLATAGWIITNILNRRQSKIQHTSRLIEHFTDDPQAVYHNTAIIRCSPPEEVLTKEQIETIKNEEDDTDGYNYDGFCIVQAPLVFSIIYILNRFEMIAIHYYDDTVDRDLVRRHFNPVISRHLAKYQNLIREARKPKDEAADPQEAQEKPDATSSRACAAQVESTGSRAAMSKSRASQATDRKNWNALVDLAKEWFSVDLDDEKEFTKDNLKDNYMKKYKKDYAKKR